MKLAIRLFPSLEVASHHLALKIVEELKNALDDKNLASLVLSGGGTPKLLFQSLGQTHRESLDWDRVHIYWVDERLVDPSDPNSNFKLASDTMLGRLGLKSQNVFPMIRELTTAAKAASEYQKLLQRQFGGPPSFDVVLLGLGSDGHTASLFPGSPVLAESEVWVQPATTVQEPRDRITLTLPVLNRAKSVHFLVSGSDKAEAVRKTLGGAKPPECPAAGILPENGTLSWWLDNPAAGLLKGIRIDVLGF